MSHRGFKAYRQGRTNNGELNRTEKQYAEILKLMQSSGEILSWDREPLTFKVGEGKKDARYKPDFGVEREDYYELIEVKGGLITPESKLRFKAAVKQYPWLKWSMWQYKNKKTGWIRIDGN